MAVSIVRQANDFVLTGVSARFTLTVYCAEQIRLYNNYQLRLYEQRNNPRASASDADLLSGFSTARDVGTLSIWVEKLNKGYRLHRRPVFKSDKSISILLQHLDWIRDIRSVAPDTIDDICAKFDEIRTRLSEDLQRPKDQPLPDVTLSKLLHFIHPNSYWIVDSRVNTILRIWRYSPTYLGYGKFLADLFGDSKFSEFNSFLHEEDQKTLGNHIPNYPRISLLKLLDKVLWFE